MLPTLGLGFLLAVVISGRAAEPNVSQAKLGEIARLTAEVVKLHGSVIFDQKSLDRPVMGINLSHPRQLPNRAPSIQ